MSQQIFNLASIFKDAKKVISNPTGFFRGMPKTGDFITPLLFAVIMAFITGIILASLSFINPLLSSSIGIYMPLVLPIMALIGSFTGAVLIFAVWKLMGSTQNYQTAYRCMAYSFAIAPIIAAVSFIPYFAGILKTIWSCYLWYIASTETHSIKAGIAKITFGAFAVIGLVFGIGLEQSTRKFNADLKKMEIGLAANTPQIKIAAIPLGIRDHLTI